MEVGRAEVGPVAVGSGAGHRRDPADVPVLLPPLMPHPNALLQALEMLRICHCACFSCAHLASDKARSVNKRGDTRQAGQVFLQGDFLLHCHHRIGRGMLAGVVWGYT